MSSLRSRLDHTIEPRGINSFPSIRPLYIGAIDEVSAFFSLESLRA